MLFAGVCTGQRHLCLYLCVFTGSIRIVDMSYRIWTFDRCEWRSKKRNHAWSATDVPLRDMAEVSNFCRIHRLTDRKSIKELFAYCIFIMLSGLVQRIGLCMYCMYLFMRLLCKQNCRLFRLIGSPVASCALIQSAEALFWLRYCWC
jgi:hypothetical protein